MYLYPFKMGFALNLHLTCYPILKGNKHITRRRLDDFDADWFCIMTSMMMWSSKIKIDDLTGTVISIITTSYVSK